MNRNERRRADHNRRKWDLVIQRFISCCNDCCSCCNRPFSGMEKTSFGIGSERQLMYVGTCCASKVKLIIAEGVAVTQQEQVQYLSREDLDWFAANSSRSHRIRSPLQGEVFICEMPSEPKVIVRKVKPGVHNRVVVGGDASLTIPDEEVVLNGVYDLALKAQEVAISPAEITMLTAQYLSSLKTALS